MPLRDALILDFDEELAKTRTALSRIPADKLDWRPHPKSPVLAWLGGHLAQLPQWGYMTLTTRELDIMPGGAPPPRPDKPSATAQILEVFDRNAAATRAVLSTASDEDLMAPWSLLINGETKFTLPRIGVLRSMVLHHIIHHRAQLGLYLRMNDVSVPGHYGPSADESPMG